MPVTRNEAADALRDIGMTEKRSARVRGYGIGAPHCFVWGAVWFLAYGGTDLYPAQSGTIWLVAVTLGTIASLTLGIRAQHAAGVATAFPWRWLGLLAAIFAFIQATFLVLRPTRDAQIGAFIPLVVALLYAIAGIWLGLRVLIAGIAIGTLTLIGYFYLPQHFALWMAVVGGGALVFAGVWLRRA